jgi:DNA polymerase-1
MYPGAKAYISAKHAEARRWGFVRDMWGRLRWLEGVHAADDYLRAEAERQAQATPTQSGAQGIIKRVMRRAWPILRDLRKHIWVEPLLQVHDALVLEYDLDERLTVDAIMQPLMTTTCTLRVPIRSSFSYGPRLGDL